MENISHLPWLHQTFNQVTMDILHGTLGHGLLLGIERGYGGEILAQLLAATALCQHPTPAGACGHCKSCQLFSAANHPDFYLVQADGNQIKVDQIRSLCTKLSATAQQGGRRVAVIQSCEKMNQAAANALLKTLEEPGRDTLLLLQTDTPNRLLATISSRCQRLSFVSPQIQELKKWFNEHYGIEEDITWALPVLGGPIALAEAWQNGHYQDLKHFKEAWQKSLQSGNLNSNLLNLTEVQIINALKILYLVLKQSIEQRDQLSPFYISKIFNLAARVMNDCHELSVMPNVNYTGLCQDYVNSYKSIIN